MKRSISTAVLGVVCIAAIVAVPSAFAAYTSTKLEVSQVGTTTTIKASLDPNDDSTASIRIYVPTGTQLTTSQKSGTSLGRVQTSANALALGGVDLGGPSGPIVVAAPGQVPAAAQAACLQGATPLATWLMLIQYQDPSAPNLPVPMYLVATAGAATALGPGYVQVCLSPPDIPESQGGAPVGLKLYSATFTITGVFSPVPVGAWIAFWTPYNPGVGTVNTAATVASPAAVAPGAVSIAAKKSGLGAIVSGNVTQAGQGRGSAAVAILGGARASGLKKLGTVKANANGSYSFRAKRGTFFKATVIATPTSAPPLCTQLAPLLPVPCVNPTVNGFTASSKTVKKK